MMSVLYDKVFPVFYTSPKTVAKVCGSVLFTLAFILPCAFYLDTKIGRKIRKGDVGNDHRVKTILYWTKIFDNENFYFGEGEEIFRGCKVSACRATHDRRYQAPEEFDAVLFHGPQINPSDLPRARSPSQKYVFVDLESPANWGLETTYLPDKFYNWTMTYSRDSDLPRPYGNVVHSATNDVVYPLGTGRTDAFAIDIVHESFRSQRNYTRFEGKRRTAAWFVSHCRTTGLRERYVAELQKYVDVDVYGKCGPHYCKSGGAKCYEMLEARYYFYLSFENSLCEDYVTEKLYKVMVYDVIPIVYGAVNYTEFAPPVSFINVADFPDPERLANYLKHLIASPWEYAEYFWWKNHFHVDLTHRQTLCKFCEMLHDRDKLAPSIVSQVKEWWSKRKCLDSDEFLKNITRRL